MSFAFDAAVVDGAFGVLSQSATASLDNFRFRTNDPAFTAAPRPLPVVSIADATVVEGAAGTSTTVTLTLTLSAPAAGGETVEWMTVEGSAGNGSDYLHEWGKVVFAAGATSATIALTLLGDGTLEPDEMLTVALSRPLGLAFGTGGGKALVTIVDDDGPQVVTVTAPVAVRGRGGAGRGDVHGRARHERVERARRRACLGWQRDRDRRLRAVGVRRHAVGRRHDADDRRRRPQRHDHASRPSPTASRRRPRASC